METSVINDHLVSRKTTFIESETDGLRKYQQRHLVKIATPHFFTSACCSASRLRHQLQPFRYISRTMIRGSTVSISSARLFIGELSPGIHIGRKFNRIACQHSLGESKAFFFLPPRVPPISKILARSAVGVLESRGFFISPAEYQSAMRASRKDGGADYWKRIAEEHITWFEGSNNVLDTSESPLNKWFSDGKLNVCYNAIDRHVSRGRGGQTAISYHSCVGGLSRDISYEKLLRDVSKLAGSLHDQMGVRKGDTVLIYMPMIPEAIVAMLACARIGAVHSVVFGGFAAHELCVRIDDCSPKVIITASCGLEAKRVIPYMPMVDKALELAGHKVSKVVVKRRTEAAATGGVCELQPGRDLDFDQMVEEGRESTPCEPCAGSDPLYILYTSGTTGKPKGVVHDCAYAVPLAWSMDAIMRCKAGQTFFCASDIGWAVGHAYTVYAPLITGCTSVLFEGKPVGTPDAGAYWRVVEKHRPVSMFTAPTALRVIRQHDPDGAVMRSFDLSSLKALFVAGERADPDTVRHYTNNLCIPVVDNYWQTESGWPMCGMQSTSTGFVPGSCGLPVPGYDVVVMNPETGREVKEPCVLGDIAVRLPLPPGFMPTLYKDDNKFIDHYLKRFPGFYEAGDCGFKDENGYVHIMARTDDVINVAGHRIATGQLEEICMSHPEVVECAVVGTMDDIKGEVPVALLVVSKGLSEGMVAGQQGRLTSVTDEVVGLVRERLGAIACLKKAAVVSALPKTRSGKILRNVVRAISDDKPYNVPATIEDESVIEGVKVALRGMGYASSRRLASQRTQTVD